MNTTTTTMTQQEWNICEDGAVMLNALGQVGEPGSDARRPLVLAACECARLALPHVLPGEDRPRLAIETAERWAQGEDVTLEQVRVASRDVFRAAHDAATAENATAHSAASAAWDAAATAWTAATHASDVAHDAAIDAAYAATHAAAKGNTMNAPSHAYATVLLQCADIVRRYFPAAPLSI